MLNATCGSSKINIVIYFEARPNHGPWQINSLGSLQPSKEREYEWNIGDRTFDIKFSLKYLKKLKSFINFIMSS